jgi:predicted secreted protein
MSTPMAVAVYFTIWWIVLFAVLPFGVQSQHEAHEAGAGQALPKGADPGAPAAPKLIRTALWTTLISAVLFAALYTYMSLNP